MLKTKTNNLVREPELTTAPTKPTEVVKILWITFRTLIRSVILLLDNPIISWKIMMWDSNPPALTTWWTWIPKSTSTEVSRPDVLRDQPHRRLTRELSSWHRLETPRALVTLDLLARDLLILEEMKMAQTALPSPTKLYLFLLVSSRSKH